jgi:uncharacterized OsmC-like protein
MPVINGLETEKLLDIVQSVKKNWETGKTVWTASAKWLGGFRVETGSRGFRLLADEPDMLAGTNTAANPVELVLQAYGACLAIGYAMNAAVRGIRIHDLRIDVEGEIDLPGFLGLEPPENLNMDRLPGYKNVTARVKIKADADKETLKELHDHVVRTSPVGITISRPVKIETELEALQVRSAA